MPTIEELLVRQEHTMNTIQRALPNFKKLGKAKWTAAVIRTRLTSLNDTFRDCGELDIKINLAATEAQKTTITYFVSNLFLRCEDIYQDTVDFMANALSDSEPSSTIPNAAEQPNHGSRSVTHLPRIRLPSFNGTLQDWESFRDQFTSLIHHDSSLSNVEKMHYLKTSVEGEALRALNNLPVTDTNYEVAWRILSNRYENKRILITKHITTLLNFPALKTESLASLQELRDTVISVIQALRNLNRAVDSWPDFLIIIVSQKFDLTTRRAWETKLEDNREFPACADLDQFLEARIHILAALQTSSNQQSPPTPGDLRVARPRRIPSHVVSSRGSRSSTNFVRQTPSSTPISCAVCQGDHKLFHCPRFTSLSVNQRREIVQQRHLCFNCLSEAHAADQCSSLSRCRDCGLRHHTLLHRMAADHKPELNQGESSRDPGPTVISSNSVAPITRTLSPVLLATARIRVCAPNGRWVVVRALLDQGSAATLISEKVAQALKVPRRRCSLRLAGISGVETRARHTAPIIVTPVQGSSPTLETNAVILSSLTQYAPEQIKPIRPWESTQHLPLADPDPCGSDSIDVILGADLYIKILRNGTMQGGDHEPGAQNTIFGWVLSGRLSATHDTSTITSCSLTLLDRIDHQLRQFWEIEEIPSAPHLSPAEQLCEEHFRHTHYRDHRGRYVVRLPFTAGKAPDLGDSRATAEVRLRQLERRLTKDSDKATAYRDFMAEYATLGHMRRIDAAQPAGPTPYYIPHHAIFKQNSSTTKLRVVFNASAPTTNGNSLNDYIAIGPKLQTDLAAVILRWRQCRFVLTADVEKMYRQILIHPADANYQRVLWRSSSNLPVEEFQLRTVTYGTASAPFLALRVLRQLAEDEGANYPKAVSVIRDQTYVDDCIFGADDIRSTKQIRDQLIALLNHGGFHLRKWASNHSSLLQDLDPSNYGLAHQKDFQTSDCHQVLGLSWQPRQDSFRCRLNLPAEPSTTKRRILSTIARCFDPLGWLTPVLVTAKVYMQQLWTLQCDWDENIPLSIQAPWDKFYARLSTLNHLTIPRWTGFSSRAVHWELHSFADASTTAYAAAVYARIIPSNGPITTSLLIAKSKVAPIKTVSVPRLELCAAQLSAKLVNYVTDTLVHQANAVHCWTDSTIVLAWIRQPPSQWKTFIANRVACVQQYTASATWHHVPTHDNPADCASRGITPDELIKSSLWWQGPDWLQQDHSSWPTEDRTLTVDPTAEANRMPVHHLQLQAESWDLQSRFSSWPKLLRVTALIYRFIHRARQPSRHNKDQPSTDRPRVHNTPLSHEFNRAKIYWLLVIQCETLTEELETLQLRHCLAYSSPLSSFSPFLDSDGLMRVGGRLKGSELNLRSKHPVLLRSHPLVSLIIRHHHLLTLHGGSQLTIRSLRQEFWIMRARPIVRSVIHQCVPCVSERAAISTQLMGELPEVRVTPTARAFIHTGIDYAGPIAIRTTPGRGYKSQKAYIAIFICMTVKAMHIELVSDYSSAAFLAAYQRFASRRGLPTAVYSDNGTTFQGANKELQSAHANALRDHTFQSQLACAGVQWHFIPPAAPHFGGLWEAGVKSVKHHLKRCIGHHTLTFEEMTTLLCKVEACLNSRPIAPMSEDVDDTSALTPGHFLIGDAILASPEPSLLDCNEQRLSRWQLLHRLLEGIWKAWSNDYLLLLQQRPKWRTVQRLATVGRLVLLRNPNLPPSRWELGRIINCHSGTDHLTRVVTVKTATSEYVRPIVKLCFLPVEQNTTAALDSSAAGGDSTASITASPLSLPWPQQL